MGAAALWGSLATGRLATGEGFRDPGLRQVSQRPPEGWGGGGGGSPDSPLPVHTGLSSSYLPNPCSLEEGRTLSPAPTTPSSESPEKATFLLARAPLLLPRAVTWCPESKSGSPPLPKLSIPTGLGLSLGLIAGTTTTVTVATEDIFRDCCARLLGREGRRCTLAGKEGGALITFLLQQ